MDRPSLLRGLRVTASAVCLIICGLLVVLWVRSHNHRDLITFGINNSGPGCMFESANGWITTLYFPLRTGYVSKGWSAWSLPADETVKSTFELSDFGVVRFKFFPRGTLIVALHHWPLSLCAAILAGVPWLRWRFSLRTLLIATTLIAVMLGLVAAQS